MNEERRRQLLEKGRQSLQKHRQNKPQTHDHAPDSLNSSVHTPSTPTTSSNGPFFQTPSSPTQITPISPSQPPLGTFHTVNPLPVPEFHPTLPISEPSTVIQPVKSTESEISSANAQASLVAAQAEINHFKSENQALRSTCAQLQSDRDSLKRKFDELVETSAETLKSQQTALNKAHTSELAQIRAQVNAAQAEEFKLIDQLQRDKAEMQGVIHLLQQQVSSVAPPDHGRLDEEKAQNARLLTRIRELTSQLETTSSIQNQKTEHLSSAHQSALQTLNSQHDMAIATLKLDHASEIQQLRTQLQKAGNTNDTILNVNSSLELMQKELQEARMEVNSTKERLQTANERIARLSTEIDEKDQNLAELDGKLRRTSEQAKTLQSQTSANFTQIEQMKQQVLRDRADLSKKLSLIAPETIRRVDQLQSERDTLNVQFSEMAKSLADLARQKNEILAQLAAEVSRNSALVHQNSQLRHELTLQLSTTTDERELIPPPISTISDQTLEQASAQLSQTTDPSANDLPDPDTIITEVPPSEEVTKKKNRAKATRSKKTRSSSPTALPSSESTKMNPKPINSQVHDEKSPNTRRGWLSSVPLVGRMWQGQPQIRHSTQVDL